MALRVGERAKRRPPGRPGRTALRLAVGLAALALAAPLWLPQLALVLVVADPLRPADAVVPLAGDYGGRVRAAAELWRAGYGPAFVITDLKAGPDGRLFSFAHVDWAAAAGIPAASFVFTEQVVTSTYTELQAIRRLAEARSWRTLIIVTSPQHTSRTHIQVGEVFRNSGISVIVRPVVGEGYQPERWWETRSERQLTLMEYAKLLVYLFGYRGGPVWFTPAP